jgi:cytochrome P450
MLGRLVGELACRYGPIFRTNLVGEDLVVSLDAELNAHVLKQEERGFQIWYPPSFMRVFGADNITAKLGVLHHHMRTLVLRLFGHQTVRSVLLHDVQRSARDELRSWLGRPDVEVRTATSRVSSSSLYISSFHSLFFATTIQYILITSIISVRYETT